MEWMTEFTSKWGFEDGNETPDGVDEVRELFITTINHYAKQGDSFYRAYPYNRTGMHNYCMIIYSPANASDIRGQAVVASMTDDAFRDALDRVNEIRHDLSSYVHVSYEVNPDVYEWLGIATPDTLECRQCYVAGIENETIINGLCADCTKNNAQKKENDNG